MNSLVKEKIKEAAIACSWIFFIWVGTISTMYWFHATKPTDSFMNMLPIIITAILISLAVGVPISGHFGAQGKIAEARKFSAEFFAKLGAAGKAIIPAELNIYTIAENIIWGKHTKNLRDWRMLLSDVYGYDDQEVQNYSNECNYLHTSSTYYKNTYSDMLAQCNKMHRRLIFEHYEAEFNYEQAISAAGFDAVQFGEREKFLLLSRLVNRSDIRISDIHDKRLPNTEPNIFSCGTEPIERVNLVLDILRMSDRKIEVNPKYIDTLELSRIELAREKVVSGYSKDMI